MDFIPLRIHLSNFLNDLSSQTVNLDGTSLSLSSLVAVARHKATTTIIESTRQNVQASRDVLLEKLEADISIYGVSTGFGGSASTRTRDHLGLGLALFQMQHCGVIPTASDHLTFMSMPESWVRAAILVRINSLVRGHSGVRWELPVALQQLLTENIIPLVPLRGSISASGDLSPLSYVAGSIMGNPSIKVYDTCSQTGQRVLVSSPVALANHNILPLVIQAKEHLGLLNGTAFSAAVASLALYDTVQLAFLTQVCTAMATEALLGSRGSFLPFVNDVARPHPGQIDVARTILALLTDSQLARTPQCDTRVQEDKGTLKQDRYALRTSPQFIGPQIEDIHSALMTVTNAMEKTRLALHHLGKILFAQATEMMNPDTNKGLPPSLAATDPSLNFHCKGVEISLAAYISELGFLANPVSTHIQSAEMHNQAIKSDPIINFTALDLRALQYNLVEGFRDIIEGATARYFWTKEPLSPVEYRRCERSKLTLTESGIGTGKGAESRDSDLISPHERGPRFAPDIPCASLVIPGTTERLQERRLQEGETGKEAFRSPQTPALAFFEEQISDVNVNVESNNISDLSDSTLSDDEYLASSRSSVTSMESITGDVLSAPDDTLIRELKTIFIETFWSNTTMDAEEQVRTAVDSVVNRLLREAFQNSDSFDFSVLRTVLPEYRASLEKDCLNLVRRERKHFLTSPMGELPTPALLGLGSRRIYTFVRKELGIRMHGVENLVLFEGGLNSQGPTTGESISLIYGVRNFLVKRIHVLT
ncbi:hypothetical protein Clacol_007843 [Clathrus columnatus]|uniref:Phenylalanine ammonia-lyase n=1 Tax=Clathrus columnatus TaxID=1419009 RepID=A0AAV5AIS0_9AGAM|nr:hypothetical protein Clacol_007843 [Clathrus columnatus]